MPFPFEPTVYTRRDIRIEVDPRISKCKNIRSSIDICRLAMLMMMNVKFDRKQSVIVATGLVTVMSLGLRVVNQCYRIIESVCTFRTRVVLVLKILYLFTFLNFGIRRGYLDILLSFPYLCETWHERSVFFKVEIHGYT